MPESSGHTVYQANGILETEQETILATRNGEIVQTTVEETKSFTEQNTYTEIIQNVVNENPTVVMYMMRKSTRTIYTRTDRWNILSHFAHR